mmetsp:Transcript_790/g.2255  ORF Transcript_790/g.2255 Transcript_790/m.2255 type:complete len:235 (-) Transcript_790:19-723(-)
MIARRRRREHESSSLGVEDEEGGPGGFLGLLFDVDREDFGAVLGGVDVPSRVVWLDGEEELVVDDGGLFGMAAHLDLEVLVVEDDADVFFRNVVGDVDVDEGLGFAGGLFELEAVLALDELFGKFVVHQCLFGQLAAHLADDAVRFEEPRRRRVHRAVLDGLVEVGARRGAVVHFDEGAGLVDRARDLFLRAFQQKPVAHAPQSVHGGLDLPAGEARRQSHASVRRRRHRHAEN